MHITMSPATISTMRWRTRSASRPAPGASSDHWPRIHAEQLQQVREPLGWMLRLGRRALVGEVRGVFGAAARGPGTDWLPPAWLLPHQVDAARRLAGILRAFGGALCGDAVGLGKTF